MRLTTEELCRKALGYEAENVWAHRLAIVGLVGAAGAFLFFAYSALTGEQPWIRASQAYLCGLLSLACAQIVRRGPRRAATGEPCVSFLVREFEGKRDVILGGRRALFLLAPPLLAGWWASHQPLPFLISGAGLVLLRFVLGKQAENITARIEALRR